MFDLREDEMKILKSLSTPLRIQSYLDTLPINHEKKGETCFSPRQVLEKQKAHCLEGAFLAATALWLQGEKPLIMNFKTTRDDEDHAVTLYRINGHWGALSKTNHAILRFRDPIYKNVRELALSYFHEYFLFETGKKTLRGYSDPVDLRRFGSTWITEKDHLWPIADHIARLPHNPFIPEGMGRYLRPASAFERQAIEAVEWPKSDPRT